MAPTLLPKTALDRGAATRSLIPAQKNNFVDVATCKPAPTRELASRHKSGMSSTPSSRPSMLKRSSSPTVGRASPVMQPKRALSTDRKRPIKSSLSRPLTPSSGSCRSTTPVRDTLIESRTSVSSKTHDGLWPRVRNLSSSFQLESVATAISKKEKGAGDSSNQTPKFATNGLVDRKRSPLRGRNTIDQSENSRPFDQYSNSNSKIIDRRWPAMLGGKLSGTALSRSADLTDKANGNVFSSRGLSPRRTTSDGPARGSQQLLTEAARRLSLDGNAKVGQDVKSCVLSSSRPSRRSLSATRSSRTSSFGADQDAKSGMNTSSHISERPSTGTRQCRVQTMSSTNIARPSSPTLRFSGSSSPARRFGRPSSPAPNIIRPSSPSKAFSTSSSNRGAPSPSRTRTSAPISQSVNASNHLNATSSNLNYISDFRKAKKNANHVEDAHQLRLLHNVIQQWRFVNAQANETMRIKKMIAENALRRMWSIISSLCESVIVQRADVQYLQQEMKLDIILNEQLEYLELWPALEREHCISLLDAAEALRANTLCLPVTGGAKADIIDVRNSVSSAVDVMQAMSTSICHLMSKVEGRKSLLSELSAVAAKEKTMLDECRELLHSAATLQVQESNLITHRLRQQDAHNME